MSVRQDAVLPVTVITAGMWIAYFATVDTAVHAYRQAVDTVVNLAWDGSSARR